MKERTGVNKTRIKKFTIKKLEDNDYTYVTAKVANPLSPQKMVEVEFLCDTGASGCAIPSRLAGELGITPKDVVDVGLADGSSIKAQSGFILLCIGKHKVFTWAVIGDNFPPIIGVDVMRVLKLHVDVKEKKALVPINHFKARMLILNLGFIRRILGFEEKGEGGR